MVAEHSSLKLSCRKHKKINFCFGIVRNLEDASKEAVTKTTTNISQEDNLYGNEFILGRGT